MDQPLFLFLLFVIGFIASFIGNFISGGISLVGVSSMLFFGIPAHLTLATQSIGTLGWRLGGLRQFWKAKKIVWKLVFPLAILAFIGSIIGSRILVSTNEAILNKLVSLVILLFIPLSLVKKNLGVERIAVSKAKEYLGYFCYFLASVWTGFFSAGAGIFFLYIYMYFFGLTILELKGTDKIPGIFLDIGSIIIFALSGLLHPSYILIYFIGTFFGSIVGAKYAIKLGDRWLRVIILITIALFSLKLLFQ